MSRREDHGWHDDRPCPDWCVTGEQHLGFQLRSGNDFWHESKPVELTTTDVDHNWHPVPVRIKLLQREQVDERGHVRHPAEVDAGGYSLTPDQSRELAAALMRMAAEAEAVPADIARK